MRYPKIIDILFTPQSDGQSVNIATGLEIVRKETALFFNVALGRVDHPLLAFYVIRYLIAKHMEVQANENRADIIH